MSAKWLPPTVNDLQQAIVRRALLDVGVCEDPVASNRGPEIDEFNRATGSPLGSSWCANAVATWFRDSGARIPTYNAGACQQWMGWAQANDCWFAQVPEPGWAVLYGSQGLAHHMEVVVRTSPLILSVGGNTTIDGFTTNGELCTLKVVAQNRVLGYIKPLMK